MLNTRLANAGHVVERMRAAGALRLLLGALLCAALLAGGIARACATEDVDPSLVYQVIYRATLDPKTGQAQASVTIEQPRQLVRSIELVMPGDKYLNIRPASRVEIDGDRVIWRPERKGSVLQYDFVIAKKRDNGLEDARITDTWALLKLDNLFPKASARVVKGATSEATMKLTAPKGWAIETPYGRGAGQVLDVSNPRRRFDRPLGWMLAGELGVRRDKVGEHIISVASPLGSGIRANEVLVFLHFTIPSLIEVLADFPQRLLIVSGTSDMWRGGLSGTNSLYLHADRPLISGNRTSPLLHEVFHVASRLRGKGGADWIVEGLAEYYALAVLMRSGGISERRFNEAFDSLARWSEGTQCVATDRSQGKQNAHAAIVMRALDTEIRAATGNKKSLDNVVQKLVRANRPVTNADFRAAVTELLDRPARALQGCP